MLPPAPAPGPGPASGDIERRELSVRDEPQAIRRVEEGFLDAVRRFQYPATAVFALRLALEEAVANAFRHGHRDLPDTPIRVLWEVGPEHVLLEVEDRGPGFKPESVPDCTAPDRLEVPSGRGLMLMRAYMTSVEYVGRGNLVRMRFRRSA